MPYAFMIGPAGEFGIAVERAGWVALHSTVEGWVESLALAAHAAACARQVIKLTGDEIDDVDLRDYEPVGEVRGLADTWWRGADSLLAVYTGEAEALDFPEARVALRYCGLDRWGLYGGERADA